MDGLLDFFLGGENFNGNLLQALASQPYIRLIEL